MFWLQYELQRMYIFIIPNFLFAYFVLHTWASIPETIKWFLKTTSVLSTRKFWLLWLYLSCKMNKCSVTWYLDIVYCRFLLPLLHIWDSFNIEMSSFESSKNLLWLNGTFYLPFITSFAHFNKTALGFVFARYDLLHNTTSFKGLEQS